MTVLDWQQQQQQQPQQQQNGQGRRVVGCQRASLQQACAIQHQRLLVHRNRCSSCRMQGVPGRPLGQQAVGQLVARCPGPAGCSQRTHCSAEPIAAPQSGGGVQVVVATLCEDCSSGSGCDAALRKAPLPRDALAWNDQGGSCWQRLWYAAGGGAGSAAAAAAVAVAAAVNVDVGATGAAGTAGQLLPAQ
jgi:hypothetical protein